MNKNINIEYLGHDCFIITSNKGVKILVDPYLTGNATASCTADSISNIDIVAVSHGAFDHLGDAISICKKTNAQLFCGTEVAMHARYEGIDPNKITTMIYGTSRIYKGVEVRSLEAKHLSMVSLGEHTVSGSPMSFVFRMEDGIGIYFSGDTSIFSDLKLFGELYPVEIGLLGMDGIPGCAYEMDGKEAALAAKWLGVKIAIPMHYPESSPEPSIFKKILRESEPAIDAVIMKPGEKFQY